LESFLFNRFFIIRPKNARGSAPPATTISKDSGEEHRGDSRCGSDGWAMDLGLEDRRKEQSAGQRGAAAGDREARDGSGGQGVLDLCIHKLKYTHVHFSATVYIYIVIVLGALGFH
jgi:hypothetical protein